MKNKIFIIAIFIIVGIFSCKRDKLEEMYPDPPPVVIDSPPIVVPIIYADSVNGNYAGIDIYHHFWLATGDNGADTLPATITVSIDSSMSNQIIIGTDTFALSTDNSFNTIHPNADGHVFNGGTISLDGSGGANIRWTKGSAYLSSAHYHEFLGTR